jgi:hypothetical protein
MSEEQAQVAEETPAAEPAIKVVLLRSKYGSCFPGERAGYPANIADTLVAKGDAYAIGEDGQPIIPMDETAPVEPEVVQTPNNEIKEPATKKARKQAKASAEKKSEESASQSTGQATTVTTKTIEADDEALRPFVIDGLEKSVAALLVANGLTTPELVTKALADGRDLAAEIQGIGPVSFEEIKLLYAE